MTQATHSMNFLPEDYVEKRQAARTAVICIGLLVIVVSGIMGAWMFVQWQAKATFEHAAKVDAELEDMNKKIAEVEELRAEKGKMMAKFELTSTLMERVRRSVLLEELSKLQPKGVQLLSLDLKSRELPKPQLTEIEKAKRQQAGQTADPVQPAEFDYTIDLIATAANDGQVASYIAALGKSPLLTDVNLQFSDEYKRGQGDAVETLRKFHVVMRINPAADLRHTEGGSLTDAAPIQ